MQNLSGLSFSAFLAALFILASTPAQAQDDAKKIRVLVWDEQQPVKKKVKTKCPNCGHEF